MEFIPKRINFTSCTTTTIECIEAILGLLHSKNCKEKFIGMLRHELKVKHVYLFAAGRIALYSILKALEIGEGDEVVIEGYTCVAVPKAIMYTGAVPIYADIKKEDFNLDYKSLEKRITDKTKAVIVQHTYGIPCHDIWKIKDLCQKRNIYLIEDCCHSMGPSAGYQIGNIGDIAFYSTDHTKYISTSVGGFATTNDDNINVRLSRVYQKIPKLKTREIIAILVQYILMNFLRNKYVYGMIFRSDFGRRLETNILEFISKNHLTYFLDDYANHDWPSYTFPAKMSRLQAQIGILQMKKLKNIKRHKADICRVYNDKLRGHADLDNVDLLRFPLLVDDPVAVEKAVQDFCRIEFWFHPPIKCAPEYEYNWLKYDPEKCPISRYVAEHIVNLPVHPKITVKEAEEICDRILEII